MNYSYTTFREVMVFDRRLGKKVPVRVDLWFDLNALAIQLGGKALENKSGRSKLASGIMAEVKRR
jgi:hypothetical protein